MNTRQVADSLGLSIQHVRWLIRNKRMKATKVKTRQGQTNQFEYEYNISKQEVERVRTLPSDGLGRKSFNGRNRRDKQVLKGPIAKIPEHRAAETLRFRMIENDDSARDDGMIEESSERIETGGQPMRVRYQPKTPTVRTLYQQFKEGDVVLQPDFQRHFVWNRQKASNLIESLLLNIPLPLIFTAESGDKEEIVDGQQRLTSIFSFIDGRLPNGETFRLSKKLKVMADQIGGKAFSELDRSYQKEIMNQPLQVVCISEDSQEDVKFEMFERLNTNITPLNAQELRNCLYRGPYNDFLKRMATLDDYRFILNKPNASARMFDVENVLMFCTFCNGAADRYAKSLKQTMNEEMRERQNMSTAAQRELERQFKKSVKMIKHVFGRNAFNIYQIDTETKCGGYSTQFNQGLFQILMHWFTRYEQGAVIERADLIKEELLSLQVHNEEFIDTLTGSGTGMLPENWSMWYESL